MDPIDGVSRALQLMRLRLADEKRSSSRGSTSTAAPGAQERKEDVRGAIATRLGACDRDDPAYLERATEVFVEAVLLDEFGEGMSNDVQFRQVILGVAREMRAQPETARQLEQLFESLRRR
jgi:hypothetical protein